MLKILAILALFLCAVVYNYADKQSPAHARAQHQKPSQPTPPIPIQAAGNSTGQGADPKNNPSDEPKSIRVILPSKDKYDYVSFGVSIALLLTGIVGVIAAFSTLGVIRRQTTAAEAAAKAALRQAEHMVTSQRAWIIASPQTPTPPIPPVSDHENAMAPMLVSVNILFDNKGNTPAFIRKIATGACAIPSNQMPDFTSTQQSGELGDVPVVPGHSFGWEHERVQIERAIKIRSGELSLWIYGIVSYADTFNEKRDTGFCFRFEPSSGQWLISGNPGDNWAK